MDESEADDYNDYDDDGDDEEVLFCIIKCHGVDMREREILSILVLYIVRDRLKKRERDDSYIKGPFPVDGCWYYIYIRREKEKNEKKEIRREKLKTEKNIYTYICNNPSRGSPILYWYLKKKKDK